MTIGTYLQPRIMNRNIGACLINLLVFSVLLLPIWAQPTPAFAQSGHSVKTKRPAIEITRPGAVAVDALKRKNQLSDADAMHMCPGSVPVGSLHVFDSVTAPRGYGLDKRYYEVGARFRSLGAACLRGIANACDAVHGYALDWAQNSGLGGPEGRKDKALYWNNTLTANMRLLAPMLAALGVAEQITPLSLRDRDVLDRWLKAKVDEYEHGMRRNGSYKGGKDGTRARKAAHNHAVQSSIAAMSYGAWSNDKKYFKTGIDQWFITLKSMRKDGSLPIETRRGARALFYHGRTLGALVQLAERAAVQGVDLYNSAPRKNKTIHHAVAFFLDAVEEPDLVLKYAKTNKAPGPSKDYKFQDLGGMGSTMGWVAPYISRFPDHPNSQRLKARMSSSHSEPESYLTHELDSAVRANGFSSEWIGVDAKCLYADPRLS